MWDPMGFRSMNLESADVESITYKLNDIDWDILVDLCEQSNHGDEDGSYFSELFRLTILQLYLESTEQKPTPIPKINNKPRGSRQRNVLIRRKKKLNAKLNALKQRNPGSNKITQIQNDIFLLHVDIKDSIFAELQSREEKAVIAIKSNPKYFYSYAKQFSKLRSRIGPLDRGDGSYTDHPKEMADILQKQFVSSFSDPADTKKKIPVSLHNSPTSTMDDIIFGIEDIEEALNDISPGAGTSEEDIPSAILKQCSKSLSYPIYLIWKKSFCTGIIPHQHKMQYVNPIYKNGDKVNPLNYRPISLTSHIVKTFERVIRKRLVDYLEDNRIISQSQHGFRRGRSCLSQLLKHYDNILHHNLNSSETDIIYLDFSKAFDKVDHEVLLKKISLLGISGKLYRWLENFLTGRKQSVVINGFSSTVEDVLSGVPQGSVLGPILFLLYINDLENITLNCIVGFFADDTRLSKDINTIEDMTSLQNDLNNVIQWSEENNMRLHESKFNFLCFSSPLGKFMRELPFVTNMIKY